MRLFLAASLALAAGPAAAQSDPLTAPIAAQFATRWLGEQTPVRVHGDTWFVGFKGLTTVVIATGKGLILIDPGVPQGVAQVKANIARAGFRVQDVRYVLSTESHWDHAAATAALVRDSGGTAVASPSGAGDLRRGRPNPADPQAADLLAFPAVAKVREMRDGEVLRLGRTAVTAHHTPGHAPGSTSWSWRSCEGGDCRTIVYSSSLNPISSKGFRYSDGGRGEAFRASIRKVGALPCDILISSHPDQSDFAARMAAAEAAGSARPFVEPNACKAYAAKFEALLDARLERERAGP